MKKLSKIHLSRLEKKSLSKNEMLLLQGGKYYGNGEGSCGCGCLGPSSTEDNAAANSAYLYDTPGDWKGSLFGDRPGICWHMTWDPELQKYISDDTGSRG
ncbi:TIGR04149 family rSAM-modified RiPP [Bacteroides bouchesdurhonensis]|uniref:TIGR04149 family rSAM-modified RiPP n=1 Tax=Bacteroides bouchesdurhonensis TaxID=1841855 RepID=UPI0011DC801F|nr:TIGR04149 family rSAM-modified RiPP [Bacteroides bouchesdurhonensis]